VIHWAVVAGLGSLRRHEVLLHNVQIGVGARVVEPWSPVLGKLSLDVVPPMAVPAGAGLGARSDRP